MDKTNVSKNFEKNLVLFKKLHFWKCIEKMGSQEWVRVCYGLGKGWVRVGYGLGRATVDQKKSVFLP
jgi:hypothetical protein